MLTAQRDHHNPLLKPEKERAWEAEAAFNGSIIKDDAGYTMLYRAISVSQFFRGIRMQVSSIGLAYSGDGVHFERRQQFIVPDSNFDQFGCEDPRVTKIGDTYYIFYTGLSAWPPDAQGIRVSVAVTKDFKKITKHPVTFFNAKAMVLFPQKINGKYVALLTVHTDMPPAKVCIARFDKIEQIWDKSFWKDWYQELDNHIVTLVKTPQDQVEVGAVPVKTSEGWILVYGFVQNYFDEKDRVFRIDAALLDLDDPAHVIGQTNNPLLVPQAEYEKYGMIPNVIFPSSTMIEGDDLYIYYGACDTTVCRASVNLNDLLYSVKQHPLLNPESKKDLLRVNRFAGNPIISPIKEHKWESRYTFNPGAIFLDNKAHILYRAMGDDDTSVMGLAESNDGLNITKRFDKPIYVPREPFEEKRKPGFSGCEDPRLTVVGDTIYMFYTAFDGVNPPRIALTSIKKADFIKRNWKWAKPKLISSPDIDNKDSCVLEEKVNGMYVVVHRIPPCIWLDFVSDFEFGEGKWLGGHPIMGPRSHMWDSDKIGLSGTPLKTEDGWLMLYHGVSKFDTKYRTGAALLDLANPLRVIARLSQPIHEPDVWYENEGFRPGTVFTIGTFIKDGLVYTYFGGADEYTGVATIELTKLLDALKRGK